ncbi:hypothetical protein EV144_101945 [Flavobacterium sp. 270]|uniref:hypothetical protein n=1 Tax=Flavobacterium sp. 270 TaxID=2512114 RepID=UPI001064F7EF|nr:hypothetical protein [Flavobacterium sp. 270]TDW52257.1 hypothetical protein EV144_101945 [Flavobacterium sp. 270]
MAIWQYLLIVVPEKSIQNDYQCIFKNNKTKFLPQTKSFWKVYDKDVSSIISGIDQIIKRADWSSETLLSWKGNTTNEEDNDCSISINKDKTRIKEFQFRVDLRKESNLINFLIPILKICEMNKLVLIDLKGEIHKPKIEDIITSIKASNATAFLNDPIAFLKGLPSS